MVILKGFRKLGFIFAVTKCSIQTLYLSLLLSFVGETDLAFNQRFACFFLLFHYKRSKTLLSSTSEI